jgi:hypothetical protein
MSLGVLSAVVLASLDVDWRAPESCPPPDVSLLSSATGKVQATIDNPSRATWILDLAFLEPFQATRRLELSSCTDVRRAARALLVLGLKGAEAFTTAPAPTPPPLTESSVELPPPPSPPAGPRLALSAGALASALTVPSFSPRLVIEGSLGVGAFEAAAMVRGGLPVVVAGGPTATAAVSIWPTLGGELLGCVSPSHARAVRPAVCGAMLGEWWQLRGQGVSDPRGGSSALVGLGAQARVTVELGSWLQLTAFLTARGHLLRPVAQFEGVDAVAAAPFSVEVGALLGLRRK